MMPRGKARNAAGAPDGAAKASSASNGAQKGQTGASQVAPAWRHLPFYDTSAVRDIDDFAQSPSIFRTPANVAATISISFCPAFARSAFEEAATQRAQAGQDTRSKESGAAPRPATTARAVPQRGFILIGSNRGTIDVCSADDNRPLGSFAAFRSASEQQPASGSSTASRTVSAARVTHLSCDSNGRLYAVGEDDGSQFPLLRIFNLRATSSDGAGASTPLVIAEAKVQHGSKPHPVSALAITPSASFLSIGLADGTVLLLRGLKEALSSAPKSQLGSNERKPMITLPRFKVAYQSSSPQDVSPVTALGFSEHTPVVNQAAKEPTAQRRGPQARVPKPRRNGTLGPAEGDVAAEDDRQSPATVYLFIASITKVMRYTVLGKGAGTAASTVDDAGCALGCASILPAGALMADEDASAKQSYERLVIARDEAIIVVGQDGREMTLALEGQKASIKLVHSQLIISSPPLSASEVGTGHDATIARQGPDTSRGGAQAARRQGSREVQEAAKVTVFDLDDKIIVFSGIFNGGVRDTWHDALGDICVLGDDGGLTRLIEKPLRQKLDLLFQKSLYLLAIGVARSHLARSRSAKLVADQANIEALLADIHRKYGEYLYEKGDFEGAITQFVQTIGVTQPSYVIRKFLDAQRIRNLTMYLQELHTRGFANSDHTTLLLSCYAKLKDDKALDRFIKRPMDGAANGDAKERDDGLSEDGEDGGEADDLPFDLSTAIHVCRQGGYFEHAAYLAKRHGRPDEYVRIQMEDRQDYKETMTFLRTLSAEDAQRNLVRYASALLAHDTKATTDLLIELCSGAFAPTPLAIGSGVDAAKVESKSAAAYLAYLQVGRFGKPAPSAAPPKPSRTSSTLAASRDTASVQATDTNDSTPPPSVASFSAHFINHDEEYMRFLESVALARWGQTVDFEQYGGVADETVAERVSLADSDESGDTSADRKEQERLWNTLLELYVSPQTPEAHAAGQRRKAIALLRQHASLPYDTAQALVCCVHDDFEEGTLYLYERLGMYEEILRHHMGKAAQSETAEDGSKVISALNRFGYHMPELYALVLQHLVDSESRIKRHNDDIEKILSHVLEESLLSPLEVVQMLSRSAAAPVSLLRTHLLRVLQAQQADVATNASLTETYRSETRDKQAEIAALQDDQQTRVFQQTRCSVCHGQLDLPSVHFMCRHSFHSRCLGAGENECPVCAKSHATINEIRRNNMAFGQRHDLFISEVQEAENGFDVVAGMFSKGLFDPQLLQAGQAQQ